MRIFFICVYINSLAGRYNRNQPEVCGVKRYTQYLTYCGHIMSVSNIYKHFLVIVYVKISIQFYSLCHSGHYYEYIDISFIELFQSLRHCFPAYQHIQTTQKPYFVLPRSRVKRKSKKRVLSPVI